MNDLDRRPTEFELYGNQPRVHAIAWKVRFEITEAHLRIKDHRRRSTTVNGHDRVSGRRTDVDSYFIWPKSRRVGRPCSSAPLSPSERWLIAVGRYECCPF